MLPVIRFSREKGRPTSWCRKCRAASYGRNVDNVDVPWEYAQLVVDFLVQWLGSKAEIARRLGWSRSYLSEKRENMRGSKFKELMGLANEVTHQLGYFRKTHNTEPFVVDGNQLSEILREWRDKYLAEQGYVEGEHEAIEFGANAYLHDKTKINLRTIGRILNSEMPFVPETKADALLTAIYRQDIVDQGEIKRFPNPGWSPAAVVSYLQEQGVM